MGFTQGLLATIVPYTAPADLRGTAFGDGDRHADGQRHSWRLLGHIRYGAATFLSGAAFMTIALAGLGLVLGRRASPRRPLGGEAGRPEVDIILLIRAGRHMFKAR
jgi:hypothetical protein